MLKAVAALLREAAVDFVGLLLIIFLDDCYYNLSEVKTHFLCLQIYLVRA